MIFSKLLNSMNTHKHGNSMNTHKHGNKEKLSIYSFSVFTCKLVIWKKLVVNQNWNREKPCSLYRYKHWLLLQLEPSSTFLLNLINSIQNKLKRNPKWCFKLNIFFVKFRYLKDYDLYQRMKMERERLERPKALKRPRYRRFLNNK